MPLTRYKTKLYGWLSYAFASEVFVIVSLTLFLPICLEQFARDNGFLLPDKTEACSPPTTTADSPPGNLGRCVVKVGWLWIDSASFSLYVYSASVALQALTVISMGGIADHPFHRKTLLLGFATLGSVSAIMFLFLSSTSPLWPLAALLAVCANVGFGASTVASNAYLPSLARDAPEVVAARERNSDAADEVESLLPAPATDGPPQTPPLMPLQQPRLIPHSRRNTTHYQTTLSAATSRISALGIALGYAAGIILLVLTLIPVTKMHGSTFSLRLAIGLSGVWWAAFSVVAGTLLPSDSHNNERGDKNWNGTTKEIVDAWRRLGAMVKWREMKKLRNTFRYLAAWFLLSDGFTTITSTAILFAKTSLHLPASSLILIGVLTPLSGILGALVIPYVQRYLALSNLRVLVSLVIAVSLVPAYGCLGFMSVFQEGGKAKFGGLTTEGEMFALAVYFGLVYGAFQGYARAFYAELLPPGEEARWYGLFSITDKSSSFLGPLLVGLIADATGNIRYAFFFLVGMIWLAVPVLAGVDVERGRKDAGAYMWTGNAGAGIGRGEDAEGLP